MPVRRARASQGQAGALEGSGQLSDYGSVHCTGNEFVQSYGGTFLVAQAGNVRLHRSDLIPAENVVDCEFSVVSPGTELWQMSSSGGCGAWIPLGYMSVGRSALGEALLAPAPHGANFTQNAGGILKGGTAREQIAFARFQLIAAAGFAAHNAIDPTLRTNVVGSGPVAMGAVFELLRLGCRELSLVSARAEMIAPLFSVMPTVRVVSPEAAENAPQVIECTGSPQGFSRAVELCSHLGTLGLLGSLRSCNLCLYPAHRQGLRILGMHELLLVDEARQRLYTQILDFVAESATLLRLSSWVKTWPSVSATMVHERLSQRATNEVFQLIEWRQSRAV